MSRVEGMTHDERVAYIVETIGNTFDLDDHEAAALRNVLGSVDVPTTAEERQDAATVIAFALEEAR